MPTLSQSSHAVRDPLELPLQWRLLVIFVHQVPQSPHASVVADSDDESDADACFDGGAGYEERVGLALCAGVEGLFLDVSGLTRLRALIGGDLMTGDQNSVCGHHVALFDPQDVAHKKGVD